jgi:hypothetical protein
MKLKVMVRDSAVVWALRLVEKYITVFLVHLICFIQVIHKYFCPKFLYKLIKKKLSVTSYISPALFVYKLKMAKPANLYYPWVEGENDVLGNFLYLVKTYFQK